MSYNITNANGSPLVTIQDGTFDNTTTSLTLFGNNAPNFGQGINQNFVNILQHWASPNAPAIPSIGQLWYDTNTTLLKVYNGIVWTIATQNINLSAINVPFNLPYYGNNSSFLATISNNSIISITSSLYVPNSYLPHYITFNNNSYLFSSIFPNGLTPGITLANSSFDVTGSVSKTNKLTQIANIILTGAASGNVGLDGTSNVTLDFKFSNIYIGNTNVTISGNWSNVTVNSTGQIIGGSNIVYNDVINALGYIPFNSSNITSNLVSNTVISRDINGDFSSNLMVGIADKTFGLVSDTYITLTGDAYGVSNPFNNSNVVIQSNLDTSQNVSPGIYNTVSVNNVGIIQNAQFIDNMPIGSITLLPTSLTIPDGWAICDGTTVTLPNGYTITPPNLSNAVIGFLNESLYLGSIVVYNQNVYVAGNTAAVVDTAWTVNYGVNYIMHVYDNMSVTANSPTIESLSTFLYNGNGPTIQLSGGVDIIYPTLIYNSNIITNPIIQVTNNNSTISNTSIVTSIDNNLLCNAIALLLSSGDTNAIMMCAVDLYGDISQLVVKQILYNLQNRNNQGLPPRLGKYMLCQEDIEYYCNILGLSYESTFFTVPLQDEIMLLKLSDISNRYINSDIFPDNSKLFGAMYLGYAQYIAILQADSTSTVGAALLAAGLDVTNDLYTDNLLCFEFISAIEYLISTAINVISQNQTAISLINSLNNIVILPTYAVPISLIQQPNNISSNVNTTSNVQIITVDGMQTYYGGNTVITSPNFGGGALPYTSLQSSTNYYTMLAKTRYLNPNLTITTNGTLQTSLTTGIGIDVGDSTDILISNLNILNGTVNYVIGPIGSPQPTQQSTQNNLAINQIIDQYTSMQSIIDSNTISMNSNSATLYGNIVSYNQTSTTVNYKNITQTIKQVTPISTTITSTNSNITTIGNTNWPNSIVASKLSDLTTMVISNIITPNSINSNVSL